MRFCIPGEESLPMQQFASGQNPGSENRMSQKAAAFCLFRIVQQLFRSFYLFFGNFSYLAGTFLPYSVTASVSSAATSPFSSRSPSYFSPEASAFASAIYSSREPSAFAAAIASLTAASSSALPLDTPMEDPTTSYGTSATISRSG